jgi:hypothetical protein
LIKGIRSGKIDFFSVYTTRLLAITWLQYTNLLALY